MTSITYSIGEVILRFIRWANGIFRQIVIDTYSTIIQITHHFIESGIDIGYALPDKAFWTILYNSQRNYKGEPRKRVAFCWKIIEQSVHSSNCPLAALI